MLLTGAVSPQRARALANTSQIDQRIQTWIDRGYYRGAGLLIAKDGRVLYERYFGTYTPDTVVFIASAGKWLAAATIMTLVDEGTLSLDDPASKWLPMLQGTQGRATIRQMLSHTSGYRPYQPEGEPPDAYQTLTESVAHIVPLRPVSVAGKRFEYGGLAMQVAGRIAEIAAGQDWEPLFQARIARPLGMTHTRFTPVDQGGGHNPMLGGGARSTLRDYANFLEMIAADGVFHGARVLSMKAVRDMQADQVRHASIPRDNFVARVRGYTHHGIYGLGEWREMLDRGGRAVLISSPSWAGAYPWIDKTTGIYGVFLAHVDVSAANRDGFSGFYSSPTLALMVREALAKPQ
jgi:CubicO group peptidase (beta-lactamase class C family)